MSVSDALNLQDVLDGLGHAVLLFNSEGKLLHNNRAAATLLGTDLRLMRDQGWASAEALFKPYEERKETTTTLNDIRKQANQTGHPVRFQILLHGEYTPCWASAVPGEQGKLFTMLTVDVTDWSALTDLVDIFRKEVQDTVNSTRGHIDIITNSMNMVKPEDPVQNLTKRIGGFNRLIDVEMFRINELIRHMGRMEDLRTGRLRDVVRGGRRKIRIDLWLEDFIEDMENEDLLDPETEAHDYRARIQTTLEKDLAVAAVPTLVTRIMRDLLRNAIMYSMKATPIQISAKRTGDYVQIEVVDQGYGVRESERDRVFAAFSRARQPQIISEFGYGLSLYLSKHESEAMSGMLWYESEEKVGSTFSLKLPAWKDGAETTNPTRPTLMGKPRELTPDERVATGQNQAKTTTTETVAVPPPDDNAEKPKSL
jgi:hypothetical protein